MQTTEVSSQEGNSPPLVTHLVSRVPRHSRLSLVGSLQSPPASGDHE